MATIKFEQLVADLARNYPNQVHVEMYRHHYGDIAVWLAGLNCQEYQDYEHYSYKKNGRAQLAMCFKDPAIATLFGLKWS